ncbi:hypothetical protein ACSBR1_012947 [Camellia fascicularis]
MGTSQTMATFMGPPPVPMLKTGGQGRQARQEREREREREEVKSKLEGHSESITSLAFPSLLNLPVFVAADDQFPERRSTGKLSETKVQFQQDQKHFLVMHELKLAVFETIKLECVVGRFGRFWLRSHMQHFMQ